MNEATLTAKAEQLRKVIAWLGSPGAGLSAKTILMVMLPDDVPQTWYPTIPYDGADLGRCVRLLEIFPEFRGRLPEVAARYPAWAPIVAAWDELVELLEQDRASTWWPKSQHCCLRMRSIIDRLPHRGLLSAEAVLDGQ